MSDENHIELPLLIEVARSPKQRWIEELALVLVARGIVAQMVRTKPVEGLRYCLLVDESDGPAAGAELRMYRRENDSWPRRLAAYEPRAGAWRGSIAYVVVLLFTFVLMEQRDGTWQRSLADSEAIFRGRIDLAFRALFLHADLGHLVGNLFFGALFGFLVSAEIGSGPAWLLIFIAGGLGNLFNAGLYEWGVGQHHRSLGASTAVFGAVGLLAILEWARRRAGPDSGWRKMAPLVIALVMLGLYGVTGERTDVSAHVFGLLAGILVGLASLPMRKHMMGCVAGAMALVVSGLVGLSCLGLWW